MLLSAKWGISDGRRCGKRPSPSGRQGTGEGDFLKTDDQPADQPDVGSEGKGSAVETGLKPPWQAGVVMIVPDTLAA